MRVQDLMTWDPEACTPHHDLAHAAMIMWRRDCGIVPVVEGGTNKLIGVITDRDICMATATKGRTPAAITVGDVMSKKPTTCLPGDELCFPLGEAPSRGAVSRANEQAEMTYERISEVLEVTD